MRRSHLALGAVALAILLGVFVALAVMPGDETVTPSSARVGQCVDLGGDDAVDLVRIDCDAEHDAEIVLVTTADAYDAEDIPSYYDSADTCRLLLDGATRRDLDALELYLEFHSLADGDVVLCYATSLLGPLSAPLL